MQLLIHGGLFKTGSTFIQNTFFENRSTLLREGVIYPETGLRKEWDVGHRHLELLKSLQMEGASSVAWRHLKEEVERANVQRCVISRENFAATVSPNLVSDLAPNADVHLTLCIRHPVDYLESKYREWVKKLAYSGSPHQFYMVTLAEMDWENLLAPWIAALGEDRVHVVSIDHLSDRRELAKIVLTSAFKDLAEIGLEPTKHDNPTISNGECLLYLTANRLRLSGIALPKNRLLADLPLPYRSNEGRIFSNAIIDDVLARFGEGYKRLVARAGVGSATVSGKWASRPFDAGFIAQENGETATGTLLSWKERRVQEQNVERPNEENALARKIKKQKLTISKLNGQLSESAEKIRLLEVRLRCAENRVNRLRFWQPTNWRFYITLLAHRTKRHSGRA